LPNKDKIALVWNAYSQKKSLSIDPL
jgi:hypothetical protein